MIMYIKNYIFKISLSNNLDFISGNHNDRLIDTFDYFFSKKNLEKLILIILHMILNIMVN